MAAQTLCAVAGVAAAGVHVAGVRPKVKTDGDKEREGNRGAISFSGQGLARSHRNTANAPMPS